MFWYYETTVRQTKDNVEVELEVMPMQDNDSGRGEDSPSSGPRWEKLTEKGEDQKSEVCSGQEEGFNRHTWRDLNHPSVNWDCRS